MSGEKINRSEFFKGRNYRRITLAILEILTPITGGRLLIPATQAMADNRIPTPNPITRAQGTPFVMPGLEGLVIPPETAPSFADSRRMTPDRTPSATPPAPARAETTTAATSTPTSENDLGSTTTNAAAEDGNPTPSSTDVTAESTVESSSEAPPNPTPTSTPDSTTEQTANGPLLIALSDAVSLDLREYADVEPNATVVLTHETGWDWTYNRNRFLTCITRQIVNDKTQYSIFHFGLQYDESGNITGFGPSLDNVPGMYNPDAQTNTRPAGYVIPDEVIEQARAENGMLYFDGMVVGPGENSLLFSTESRLFLAIGNSFTLIPIRHPNDTPDQAAQRIWQLGRVHWKSLPGQNPFEVVVPARDINPNSGVSTTRDFLFYVQIPYEDTTGGIVRFNQPFFTDVSSSGQDHFRLNDFQRLLNNSDEQYFNTVTLDVGTNAAG